MGTAKKLNQDDVVQVIAYLNSTTEFPATDPKALARLAVEFERFGQLVNSGMVEDGKALEMAGAFVLFGNQWLASHPEVQLYRDQYWTFDRVKQAIAYFNNTTAVPDSDTAGMKKLVGEFDTFTHAVKDGWVEQGDAKALADEFLKIANTWFDKNPAMKSMRSEPTQARAR